MAKGVWQVSGEGSTRSVGSERKLREVAAWGKSGTTHVAFCRELSIPIGPFSSWERGSPKRDAERAAKGQGSGSVWVPNGRGGPVYAPVRVGVADGDRRSGEGGVAIVVCGSRRVWIGTGLDADVVANDVTVPDPQGPHTRYGASSVVTGGAGGAAP